MSVSWEPLVEGFGRLEAPCFDLSGRLCFSDMTEPGRVLRLERDGHVSTVASREHVGGLVPHADGGLLVGGHTLAIVTDDGVERTVFEPPGGWGFNDFVADADGSVYVGMHGERPTAGVSTNEGSLWLLRPGREAAFCYGDVMLTNGIRISPDGSSLYHVDTGRRAILVSDLADDGLPVERRVLCEVPQGSPDGMAIDDSGCLWVAIVDGGCIVRITPDGRQDLVLQGPRAWVASVTFGGDDGRDLYAVTFGAPYDDAHTGGVFRTRVSVAGGRIWPARI